MINIDVEREVVAEVEKSILCKNYEDVCYEIGKFIENITSDIYYDNTNSQPKNAKIAIDFLINKEIISRPLGFKLHVVRELRNVVVHNLPYKITLIDARASVDTLNQTIGWLHQEYLAQKWYLIVKRFDEAEKLLLSDYSNSDENQTHSKINNVIIMVYSALEEALSLKKISLNLQINDCENIFSNVELLAKHGINVRSNSWEKLTNMRNRMVHGTNLGNTNTKIESLNFLLPDLRTVLKTLNPLDLEIEEISYAKVSIDVV